MQGVVLTPEVEVGRGRVGPRPIVGRLRQRSCGPQARALCEAPTVVVPGDLVVTEVRTAGSGDADVVLVEEGVVCREAYGGGLRVAAFVLGPDLSAPGPQACDGEVVPRIVRHYETLFDAQAFAVSFKESGKRFTPIHCVPVLNGGGACSDQATLAWHRSDKPPCSGL